MYTVLFDLDGTLLPMDQDDFINAYFKLLAKKLAPHGYDPDDLMKVVWKGTEAMVKNDGSKTNEEAFWDTFCSIYGDKAREDTAVFEDFYANDFQKIKDVCGFNPKAAEIIKKLKEAGCRVVLATNPVFPKIATESRIRWAGLDPADFEYFTTYENSSYCKPNPKYYVEILQKIGAEPKDCFMVGNDVNEDIGAATAVGLKVFLLTDCLINKDDIEIAFYPNGGFGELEDWFF